MKRILILLCIAAFTALPARTQDVSKQEERKKQLEEEIAMIDKQLGSTSKKRKQSLNTLILTRQKISARQKLITQLDNDIAGFDRSISNTNGMIDRLNSRLDTLRKYHADLVLGAYKTRDNKVWFMYILSSKDINQALRRWSYLKNISAAVRQQASAIKSTDLVLQLKNARLEDQRVQSYALTGTHLLSPKFDLDWNLSYAKAQEDRPHERYIEYVQEGISMTQDLADPRKPFISAPGQSESAFLFDKLTEQHDYTDEDEYSAKINARVPLSAIASQKGRLHFGLKARIKSKERNNNFYEYTPVDGLPSLAEMDKATYTQPLTQGDRYIPGSFVSKQWLGNVDLNNPALFEKEADPSEYLVNNYQAKEQIYAGYLRWDQDITPDLTFIVGARIEHTRVDYEGNYVLDEDYDNADLRQVRNSYTNVLPNVTVCYTPLKNMVLRGVFSTALARLNCYALVASADVQEEEGES